MDSGRLELDTKSLRNFHKIYAFRPEPNLELFQVQIRTDLYCVNSFLDEICVLDNNLLSYCYDAEHLLCTCLVCYEIHSRTLDGLPIKIYSNVAFRGLSKPATV